MSRKLTLTNELLSTLFTHEIPAGHALATVAAVPGPSLTVHTNRVVTLSFGVLATAWMHDPHMIRNWDRQENVTQLAPTAVLDLFLVCGFRIVGRLFLSRFVRLERATAKDESK